MKKGILRAAALLCALALVMAVPVLAEGTSRTEQHCTTVDVSEWAYQAGGYGCPEQNRPGEGWAAHAAVYDRAGAVQALIEGMEKRQAEIPLSEFHIPGDEAGAVLSEALNTAPQLFYVQPECTVQLSADGESIECVSPMYREDYDMEAFETAVAQALQCAASAETPEEKALALHDYLAAHIAYDEMLEKYNAYEALVGRSAVGQGYALAYKLLLQKCGIPCQCISSRTMNHSWNIIELDDIWYHVDVAWDDPLPNRAGYVQHTHFLRSDGGMAALNHMDWNAAHLCTDDTKYTAAFWKDSTAAVIYSGSHAYHIHAGTVFARDKSTTHAVYGPLDSWPGSGSDTGNANFSGLSRNGNMLYWNDSKNVYQWEIGAAAEPAVVYTHAEDLEYLFGSHYWNGAMELAVGTAPGTAETQTVTLPPPYTPVAVTGVTLDPGTLTLQAGETAELNAAVVPEDAADQAVTWASSDEAVAAVDASGAVTARSAGHTTITVTTRDGGKTAVCEVTVTAAHTHSYTNEKITREPTCTEAGEKTFTCSCGDTITETIPAAGHITERRGQKEATCGTDGYTGDIICIVCKAEIEKGQTILKTGEHVYISEITAQPTCTKKGETTCTCSICGDSYTEENIDALGHVPELQGQKEATCGMDGYTGDTVCTVCGETLETGKAIPKTNEHTYTAKITKEPNYEEAGETTYVCTACGDTYTEAIPKRTRPNTGGSTGNGTPGVVVPPPESGPPDTPAHPEQPGKPNAYKPGTPATPENLAKDNWTETKTAAGATAFRHTEANGTLSTGVRYIQTSDGVGLRYVFNDDGIVVMNQDTAAPGSGITVSAEGEVLVNGSLYYLNPDRDEEDPRTCYVVTDYLRIRDNCAGQTYYDKDGITFTGWMKNAEGGLRYQTRIPQPGKAADLYLIVWRVQDLPACQHPDHPGDPAYSLPAGRYFFDDEGVLVQKEGWNDGRDGKEYYTNADGMVTQERKKQMFLIRAF